VALNSERKEVAPPSKSNAPFLPKKQKYKQADTPKTDLHDVASASEDINTSTEQLPKKHLTF
jgi:hypothetical protein